ncbi:hypothetical protein SARC_01440 [Sphaeroforma arctica JP610]|uniref:ubiquitinyl hydrolase 1 n=1 Tax=Sphaeroforma arctica JP610 TaxID=667725 RepID=A0A0L0GC00_9EUKA|nr:hypothetical protein SARC_01440 [Sphaeroforma arctica JP610]KNC86434.1 hypothetical protein SARC_01440 [Sphaeroforma arctica JP610]|eukprot:XP_014160336.1 hypothetical protein SARC_01440 [Sphaeroforma arctica JP610]
MGVPTIWAIGSDGKMLSSLTDPDLVFAQLLDTSWSVPGLLDIVAQAANPPYNSLIDTGALITGLSNLEVARYLLMHGLAHCKGVVFLDDMDRKMILIRSSMKVVPLNHSGIEENKRFAFYDQVHTTGMDIPHKPNAVAALTLGKDMTFRDFAQGAYRMRGFGIGQTVHLFLIPVIRKLISKHCAKAGMHMPTQINTTVAADRKQMLLAVSAWLIVNSMNSERVQANMLTIQNVTNVWRKQCFQYLLDRHTDFGKATAQPE